MSDTDKTRPWVWFDLDDTLWDFTGNSLKALAVLYEKYSLYKLWPDVQQWLDSYHAENSRLWQLYNVGKINAATLRRQRFAVPLSKAGGDSSLAEVLDKDYLHILSDYPETVKYAPELLARLSTQYNIGILSNGFADIQQRKLHASGLDRYVGAIVLSDDIDVPKPDVRIFRYAMQRAGLPGRNSIMVGDNPQTDILGALNAGWSAVWVNFANDELPQGLQNERRLAVVPSLEYAENAIRHLNRTMD